MFLVALKAAIVESLRATFDSDFVSTFTGEPIPKRIDIEYPLERELWPAIFVQVHPVVVKWEGINPDDDEPVDANDLSQGWTRVRRGYFEASVDLELLSLRSGERDRIWDHLVELFLMGDLVAATNDFYTTLDSYDLLDITVQKGTITVVGDTVTPGTPWAEEELTYEATLRFKVVGQFAADVYTQTLVSLSEVQIYERANGEDPSRDPLPSDTDDGHGAWVQTGIEDPPTL